MMLKKEPPDVSRASKVSEDYISSHEKRHSAPVGSWSSVVMSILTLGHTHEQIEEETRCCYQSPIQVQYDSSIRLPSGVLMA